MLVALGVSAAAHAALLLPLTQPVDPPWRTHPPVQVRLITPPPPPAPETPETPETPEAPEAPEKHAESEPSPAPLPPQPQTPPAPPPVSQPEPAPTTPEPHVAHDTRADDDTDGSFAGNADAAPGPRIRLYWPDPQHAAAVLARHDLRLIVAAAGGDGHVQPVAHLDLRTHRQPQRAAGLPDLADHDPTARNVTAAPGFANLVRAAQLAPREQLLLLLPRTLSHRLSLVVQRALRQHHLAPDSPCDVTVQLQPSGQFTVLRVTPRPTR